MTAQVPTFNAYRRRLKNAAYPCLGELVWYTVAENLCIPHGDFVKECERLGLEKYAPKMPKDVDVFRRACTQSQRKRVPVPNTEVYENYLMRDVRSAAGHFWKHLVVETVDSENRRLNFEPVAEVEFDPDVPDTLHIQYITKPHNVARHVIDDITTDYAKWRGMVYGYSVRGFIREVIGSTGATVVRPSGGVYFVLESKLGTIGKLDEIVTHFANAVSPYEEDLILHTVPLIDDARQREMLRAAVEQETVSEIDSFIAEVNDLITDGKATDDKFAALALKKNAIKDRSSEYTELLGDVLDGTDLRLKALENSLKRLYRAI